MDYNYKLKDTMSKDAFNYKYLLGKINTIFNNSINKEIIIMDLM